MSSNLNLVLFCVTASPAHGVAGNIGTYPSCQVKVGLHCGPMGSLSQGHIARQTTNCTHIPIYGQFKVPCSAHIIVFGLWKEAGEPGAKPPQTLEVNSTVCKQC